MKIKKMIESEIELPEPRPCPFCKSKHIEVIETNYDETHYYCKCRGCGVAYEGRYDNACRGFDSEIDAVRAWNGENISGTMKEKSVADSIDILNRL